MSLTQRLILTTAGWALLCLALAALFVPWQAHRDALAATRGTVVAATRLLELQLMRISAGYDLPERFPDWQAVAGVARADGSCVSFESTTGRPAKRGCSGTLSTRPPAPDWFAAVYRRLLEPGAAVGNDVAWAGQQAGRLTVTGDPDAEIASAWGALQRAFGLTALAVGGLAALTAWSIGRALKPTGTILAGLERLERGELASRLPDFHVREFARLSEAFNRLAASLEQHIAERAALAHKLLQVAEEERRTLARELHDELGQYLTATNALAASLRQGASDPGLEREAGQVAQNVEAMMALLRGMLERLRPPDLEELGLAASLESLVAGWNGRCRGTRFQLNLDGGLADLPADLNASVYRIVQECLTNSVRHARAREVQVKLSRRTEIPGALELSVADDGQGGDAAARLAPGFGVIGMRERVLALGGTLELSSAAGRGFVVHAVLPLPA
ncbi:MAG: HAMP domain-containing protein [Gammaproteobacteria bacterium]|nr:HAMP domain-containing protein [Gammaproteobacteria bacterium]